MTTWNPSDKDSNISLSGGDLTASCPTTSGVSPLVRATTGRSSGKYYFEVVITGNNSCDAGLCDSGRALSSVNPLGFDTGSADLHAWGLIPSGSTLYNAHNGSLTSRGSITYTDGDVIGVAIDFGAQKIWFAYNNTWVASGNPGAGTNPAYSGSDITGTLYPAVTMGGGTAATSVAHFTDASFTYSKPSGFSQWDDGLVVLSGKSITISRGTFQGLTVESPLTGQSLAVGRGVIVGGLQLAGTQLVGTAGALQVAVDVGAVAAQPMVPAVVQSSFSGSGGDYFPPMEGQSWAAQNNFVSYDGVLQGVGDVGYKEPSFNVACKRSFGYTLDQTTRGKTWGNASWTVSTWDAPGDLGRFDPFYGGSGNHYVSGEVYDFSGGALAHGGQFSLDQDGLTHFVHTRGYGLFQSRSTTTPDLVYYLQVADQTQKVWRRNNFTIDGSHELLMGVYGHTPTRTFVFYPTLSGSDWVPTYRVWDGTTLSSETQLTGFTGNASCNALHKEFCVTRAGYGDTLYITYYSGTGHIGLIVMDAMTLTVASHVLTAIVATGSTFTGFSSGGECLASGTPTRPLAEVVYLSSGTSVTQFLLGGQFVHLSWTSGTSSTPTLTLKTGPSSSELVGGWESLEQKGDEVYHVVYARHVVSGNFNSGTSKYDYIQDFKLYSNSAAGSGSSWVVSASPLWSWTESFTLVQLDYKQSMWFSGYGGGGQTVVYSIPAMAVGPSSTSLQAHLAWVDLWAGQQPYFSVKASGRVGRVTITIIPGVVLVGQVLPLTRGVLTPSISVALTGQSASVQRGIVVGSIPVDAEIGLVGRAVTCTQGALVAGVGASLSSALIVTTAGVVVPSVSLQLLGGVLASARGQVGVVVACVLPGTQLVTQRGQLGTDVAVNLSSAPLVATSGALVPALSLQLAGAQLQVGRGALDLVVSLLLSGLSTTALYGVLRAVLAVPITGQQVAMLRGVVGFLYDCNLYPLGIQARGEVGEDPTGTNVPAPTPEMLLWAQQEVERLFVQAEPEVLVHRQDAEELFPRIPSPDLFGGTEPSE